jgi:hypothetical protein
MTTPFWSNEPTILFKSDSILQIWPLQTSMSFEAKLNAISRFVIILSLLGFVFTAKLHFLIIGVITLAIIYSFYKYRKQTIVYGMTEGFVNDNGNNNQNQNSKNGKNKNNKQGKKITPNTFITNPVTLETVLRTEFHPTTKQNPFGNVLLTDIMDDPERKAAAPSFNPDVHEDITSAVKKQTQMLNPDINNTNKELYGDLKDNYDLDNSMMRFYSTANTKVGNDQGAFANYLYSNMPSAKEDTPEGNLQRYADSYRYTLT